jgi:hypothetical protein
MSTQTRLVASRPLPRLPDERFWQRYSRHHEAPLSGMTSIALHGAAVMLVILASVFSFGRRSSEDPLAVGVAYLDKSDAQVPGTGIGDQVGPPQEGRPDAAAPPQAEPPTTPPETAPRPELPKPKLPPIDLPGLDPMGGDDRPIPDSRDRTRPFKPLSPAERPPHVGPRDGKPGVPGGTGDKLGQNGGGGRPVNPRQLRWTLRFDTDADGIEYARQLQALGAKLAIRIPGETPRYEVAEDLKQRPVEFQPSDLSDLKTIWWIDDDKDSIAALAKALQLKKVPERIIAFFPKDMEEKLADLERKFKGKKEADIKETVFEVRRTGKKYEPVVVSQR